MAQIYESRTWQFSHSRRQCYLTGRYTRNARDKKTEAFDVVRPGSGYTSCRAAW
jgi:hypothetical protein